MGIFYRDDGKKYAAVFDRRPRPCRRQLDVIAGKRDQLAGKIQEAHGTTKEEAEQQIKSFEERNKDDPRRAPRGPRANALRCSWFVSSFGPQRRNERKQ